MSENNAAAKLTDDSDELIELAKLAEQAERYDDMKAVRIVVMVYVCVCVYMPECMYILFISKSVQIHIRNIYRHVRTQT